MLHGHLFFGCDGWGYDGGTALAQPSPTSPRAAPRVSAEGAEMQSIGRAPHPGPHLQRVSAESSLLHTAVIHQDKSKIKLQSKSHLDHHEKQRKTPILPYNILNSTLFKAQKCRNNTVSPAAQPQLVLEASWMYVRCRHFSPKSRPNPPLSVI